MPDNQGTATSASTTSTVYEVSNWARYNDLLTSVEAKVGGPSEGISPQLYFKYVKSKFKLLERQKLTSRMKKLEVAFNKAVDNGQEMLGEKIMLEIIRETRESVLLAKGCKYFIERGDLKKHKNRIRGGHISDTQFKEFTRIIPKAVLEKKKKFEGVFDGFVIYHYWNEEAEKVRAGKQKMSADEKSRMRDPVLFGYFKNVKKINEYLEQSYEDDSTRLYFIADWEDDLCDLTFSEMVDEMGLDEDEYKIAKEPKLVT